MKNKYLPGIACFFIALFLGLPFYVSDIYAYDGNLVVKQIEEKTSLYGLNMDPGGACVDKAEESSAFADLIDNDIIGTLESIFSIIYAICTTMSVTDQLLSMLGTGTGFGKDATGACICKFTGTWAQFICEWMQKIHGWYYRIYMYFKPFCCYANCGLCTQTGCFDIPGIKMDDIAQNSVGKKAQEIGQSANTGLESFSETTVGTGLGGGYGIAQFRTIGQYHLSPYENIYTALACLCIPGILFNLRKLKTIYQTHECCVEQACEHGLSTKACDAQLDQLTCMYWQGSIYKTLLKVIVSMISEWVGKVIFNKIFKEGTSLINGQVLQCILAIVDLAQIPQVFSSMTSAWEWVGRSFSDPSCGDLGFDDIEDEVKDSTRAFDVLLYDQDNDGINDGAHVDY